MEFLVLELPYSITLSLMEAMSTSWGSTPNRGINSDERVCDFFEVCFALMLYGNCREPLFQLCECIVHLELMKFYRLMFGVRPGLVLNGSKCDMPMPVRVQAWIAAWKEVNNSNIVALDGALKHRMAGLTQTQLGQNGEGLQTGFASNWIGRLGSVQVLPRGYSVDDAVFQGGVRAVPDRFDPLRQSTVDASGAR